MVSANPSAFCYRAAYEPLPRIHEELVYYEVVHKTLYVYDRDIRSSEHWLRLMPVFDRLQYLQDFELVIDPWGEPSYYEDIHGNEVIHLKIDQPYRYLAIESRSRVGIVRSHGHDAPDLKLPIPWLAGETRFLQPYLIIEPLPESQLRVLSEYAQSFVRAHHGAVVPTIDAINRAIFDSFRYRTGSTSIGTSIFTVFQRREGVCQDFTNLMLALLRILHIPARYRTGYIFNGGEGAISQIPDASHAWVEVYLPHCGWLGWDPTNGKRVSTEHIRVANGSFYAEATPTSGTIYTPFISEELTAHVTVHRLGGLTHAL